MFIVSKEFAFEAAHSLPHLPKSHKCHHLHGHSYKVIISVKGDLTRSESWVIDYADIAKVVDPIIKELDHQDLNDVIRVHTTAENIAYWLYQRICAVLPGLYSVQVKETEKTSVCYSEGI